MKVLALLAPLLLLDAEAVENYLQIAPNAQRVVVDGVTAYGLGHPSLTSRSTSFSRANPFGQAVSTAARNNRNNAAAWAAICDLDSDGDGITNGVELCDPTCSNAGRNVDCVGGAILTHPGFPNAADGSTAVPLVDDVPTELKLHGMLMIFAWVFLAPFGVARAVYYKKRGGPPVWFRDHKIALAGAVFCTYLAFYIIVRFEGTDTIKTSFDAIKTKEVKGLSNRIHAIFGVFVLVLAGVQPVSGFLRAHVPPKGQKKSFKRLAWEFQHQWTGRLTLLLAVCAVVSGIRTLYPEDGEGISKAIAAILGLFGAMSIIYVMFFRDRHMKALKDAKNSLEPVAIPEAEMVESRGKSSAQAEISYDYGNNQSQKYQQSANYGNMSANYGNGNPSANFENENPSANFGNPSANHTNSSVRYDENSQMSTKYEPSGRYNQSANFNASANSGNESGRYGQSANYTGRASYESSGEFGKSRESRRRERNRKPETSGTYNDPNILRPSAQYNKDSRPSMGF